jgi:hypothetical protein
LAGGKSGEGGGNTQGQVDKGGEGARADTRVGGSKDKDNGNVQSEATRNGNVSGVRGSDNGKGVDGDRQGAGSRTYRQDTQRVPGPSQTTLNEFWKGKEKDLRSRSADMEARMEAQMESRMRELERDRQRNYSPYYA